MMTRIVVRTMSEGGRAAPVLRGDFAPRAVAVITALVITASIIASSFGGSAAAGDNPQIKTAVLQPVSLSGRWSGQYNTFGRQVTGKNCANDGCGFTYDIVACKEGWCGITVNDDKSCGPVGVRLAADLPQEGEAAFKGKLELAKGSAAFTVEAWYRSDDNKLTLHFLGDTGPVLLLMRRSFPFEADLARTGDATCTLDKATS